MSNMKLKTKQKRNQRRRKQQTYHRSINISNLIYPKTNVAVTQDYDHSQWSLSVLNVQCIKNKEILIMDHIIENRIEACIVTETWLSDGDDIWISTNDFTNTTITIPVSDRIGEEVAWH